MATGPLRWHPRFLVHTTVHGQIVLLEDGDAVLFDEGPPAHVAQAVSRHASIHQVLELAQTPGGRAAMRVTLDGFFAHDLVQTADAYRLALPGYLRPAFEAEPRVVTQPRAVAQAGSVGAQAGSEVVLLSEIPASDPLVDWARALATAHGIAVAIVDDELDPRLEAVDRRHRDAMRPWLLFKPRGRRPSLGPWFDPEPGRPCWSCLERRMLGNQHVRRWLTHATSRRCLEIPVAIDLLAPGVLPQPPLGGALLEHLRAGALVRLEPTTAAIAGAHHVAGHEHGSRCGDPARRSPWIELRSTKRGRDPDGGYRSHSAEDTVARLLVHVSTVTGNVADVSIVPGQDLQPLPVHRSAFLTCPLGKSIVRPADFHRVALGKGTSAAQSRASALCEALERSVAQYRGDEPTVLASAEALTGARSFPPPMVRPLSARQMATFPAWRTDEPIHWVDVSSLTRRELCKVPLTYCYANTPFAREEELCRFDSNGCAAGRTLEEALLQGLLERIERDAVAIWWYNRLAVPSLSPALVGPSLLDALQRGLGPIWDWWLLDATHDLDTPVCVAVARRHQDGQYRFGFGCHVEAKLAAQRAATELHQLIAVEKQRGASFDFAGVAGEPYLHPSATGRAARALAVSTEYDDIRDAIEACIARLAARGLEVLAHRYPAIDDALAVVKTIVPGACHIWPELGASRLYRVPVDLGWSSRALGEHDLNPLPLFV
ncbi:TOMM precursor leader peptide-binding protein [Pendulispora albinea]|uniref:TOMM leader peptide-binding protein n=1 Tax=Pendulispora albinea TaxID=2741071 RepID=A0ABZ2M7C5_9BACT